MTNYAHQAHLYAEHYLNNLSAQVAERARAQAEPPEVEEAAYEVRPVPWTNPTRWQVCERMPVGTRRIATYDHKAPADRVAETLNHWASEESTS